MPVNMLYCSVIVATLAVVAVAQGPGAPGRGGFDGPGFGPPGIGMPSMRPPGMGLPGMGGRASAGVSLLGMPEVCTELSLNEAQQKSVDKIITETQPQLRAAMGDFNPMALSSLNDAERKKALDDIRKRVDKIAQRADARLDLLLTKPQSTRLAELRLQRDGAAALLRTDIAKQLGLTPEQQRKLKRLNQASRPQFGGPPDFTRMEEVRQLTFADMLAVLTDKQKSQWESLLGKPFKFSQAPFGPGTVQPQTSPMP